MENDNEMSFNKEELFQKCLDEVNSRIKQYNDRMETISGQIDIKNYSPLVDQYGNKGELQSEYEESAIQLDRVQNMKETLANLDMNHRSETVRPGSVVETKNNYYFVSVPLGEIDLESGRKVFAISAESPVYEHLEGKKAGDRFTFKGNEVEILDLL